MSHNVSTKVDSLAEELQQRALLKLDVSASRLTTFGLGGAVRYLVEPRTVAELVSLLEFLDSESLAHRILGNGSNLLINDRGVDDVVIHFGRGFNEVLFLESGSELQLDVLLSETFQAEHRNKVLVEGNANQQVFAFAGAALMPLSRKVSQLGFSGLEFAAGIPASIGGAVWMNAGAHGEAIADCLSKALVFIPGQGVAFLSAEQIGFSYRHNSLPLGSIVLGAAFELKRGDAEIIEKRRAECLNYRRTTQPLHQPSAGSVFRNPSATTVSGNADAATPPAAAVLLEKLGFKGYRRGGVSFSPMHANWLVKVADEARTTDATGLIELAKNAVQSEYGYNLKPEIKIW